MTNFEQNKKSPLKIITLSGTESVTKNLTVYEYEDDIILVDCGIGIPDSDLPGVDVVIPDFTYLYENSHKVKGLFITHGHEDHIGAIPFLLEQLDVPIYANKLVQGFLSEKLKDKQFKDLAQRIRFHQFDPDTPEITVGKFRLSSFRVNHSVPMAHGIVIRTPEGAVVHMADYKIDWTPVLDKPIDLGAIAKLGDEGVLCLLSDCLGVTTEGYSKTERSLDQTFFDLFEQADNRQIFVTTISSNLSRMYQVINAALKNHRRVVLSGRSIDQTTSVGRRLGLLPFDDDLFVKESDAAAYPQKDLVYIIAGCYGQHGSSLDRVSRGEHNEITMEPDALVIFSADPNPPGVQLDVERMMSNLTMAGAEVIYGKIQENLHVSGHGPKGDIMTVASVLHPRYFIPIGGTITKMRAFTNMITSLGYEARSVFECMEGDVVEFLNGVGKRAGHIETKPVYIGSSKMGEINPVVIRDRTQLSSDGVFVVVLPMNGTDNLLKDKIDIITRGYIYVKESQEFMEKARNFVKKSYDKHRDKEWAVARKKLEHDIENFLHKESGKRPLVMVHSLVL